MTKLSAVILMVALAANATGGAFADGKVRVAQTVIPEGTRFCFSPEVKGFNLLNDDYAVIMNGNRVEVRACRESRIPFNRVWPGRQPTKKAIRLPAASGGDVVRVDSIGRRRAVASKDGWTDVILDGSPCVVYGLDMTRIQIW